MAELILNPNSIYRKSQANFILNKDALYTFTRSISAVNNSLYGMQPTKEQLLSGFDLSDIFIVNPLSTNGSLCANVYVLDESVNALKFFSSRPFVVCKNVADRDEKAQNPFAVYLTPVVPETSAQTSSDKNNDNYEWIYVLSSFEDVSDWDVMVSAYSEWQADKENFRLTSFQGKWELIGSTSLTDEKISSLFNDVSETIERTATVLSTAIIAEAEARETAVSELEESISDICSNYETKEDAAEKLQDAKDYTDDKVSSTIETISEISAALEEQTNELIDNFNGFVSDDFVPFTEFVEEDLSGALDDEISARQASDEWLSTTFAGNLSNEIENWVNEQISAIDISDKLSNYLPLSGGTLSGNFTVLTDDGDNTLSGLAYCTGLAIGNTSKAKSEHVGTVAIIAARDGKAFEALAVGYGASANGNFARAIGANSVANGANAIAIGNFATSALANSTVAIGGGARALVDKSIQLGAGTNNETSSFQVWNYQLLDSNGDIPEARLSSIGYVKDSSIASKLSNYLPLSGGIITGPITIKNDTADNPYSKIVIADGEIPGISTEIYNTGRIDVKHPAGFGQNVTVYLPLSSGRLALQNELSNYAQLSDIPEIPPLSDFVKKSDVSEAIESALSDYQAYADGLEIPGSISAIIDWNKAIHTALKNLTNL